MVFDAVVVRAPTQRCFLPTWYYFVQLSRDDKSRTEVARYHRGSLGIVGRKRQPQLEVDPGVEHMLDLIVLTFVYVEKIRMDKDRENTGP